MGRNRVYVEIRLGREGYDGGGGLVGVCLFFVEVGEVLVFIPDLRASQVSSGTGR